MAKKRVVLYLDEEVEAAIARVAAEIHVSKSAVVSLVMSQIDEWLRLPATKEGASGDEEES